MTALSRDGLQRRLAAVDEELTSLRRQLVLVEQSDASHPLLDACADGSQPPFRSSSLSASRPRLTAVVLDIYEENHRRKNLSSQPFQLGDVSPSVVVAPLDADEEAAVRSVLLDARAQEERRAAQLRGDKAHHARWRLALHHAAVSSQPSSEAVSSAMEGADGILRRDHPVSEAQLAEVLSQLAEGLVTLADIPAPLADWLHSAGQSLAAPGGAPLEPRQWATALRSLLEGPARARGTRRTRSQAQKGGPGLPLPLEGPLFPRPAPPDWSRVAAVPSPILTPEERRRTAFVSRNGLCSPEDVVKDLLHQRANETAWTPLECKVFLAKFRQYGKYFRGIAEHLPRKDTSEVVAHYYRTKHRDPMPAIRRDLKQRARRMLQQLDAEKLQQQQQQRRAERAAQREHRTVVPHRFAQRVSARDGLAAFLGDGMAEAVDTEALQQLQLDLQLDLQNRPRTRRQSAAVK